MKKLLYLILLFTASTASAQYVSHGPRGGYAYRFYQDAGRIWLAANSGVYYSVDHGVSWIATPAASTSIFSCDSILSIAAFGNELYAGAQLSGVYHSTDAGRSWNLVNNNLPKGIPYSDEEIIGPNAFAIRADSGILYRSPDHGASWIRMNFAINNASVKWLSIHNNNLYVTTNQGLFKSMDLGASYTNINPNLADIGELVWSNDTAYVGTANGLRQSVDDGVSFSIIGLAGRAVQHVAASGSYLFGTVRSAANQDTLMYSTNAGSSFSYATFPTTEPFRLVYDIAVAGPNVVVGTNYGIYRSTPGSAAFVRSDSGFQATSIRSMAVNGLRLYAATFPMGIFFSPDSAETWRHNGDMAHGIEPNMLAIDAKNQYVHAGGALNYYRSSDFGITWTPGAAGLPAGTIASIYASKSSPDVFVIRNGDLYRSSDDGGSFSPVASGVPAGSAYYVTQADTSLFIASNGGLYKGNSSFVFTPVLGLSGRVTSVVYRDTAYFAATSGNGLHSSSNGGASWKPAAPGVLPSKVNALAVYGHGLMAATDDGLFNDSTGIWVRDSLEGKVVFSLAVMAGKIYAGTCGGVWSLQNLPTTPPPSKVGSTVTAANALQVYPNPSAGDFRAVLAAAKAGEGELTLRDMIGHTVLRRTVMLDAGRNELRVSAAALQLPAGVYVVQVRADNQIATRRIVLR